jgi:hypothetical protein
MTRQVPADYVIGQWEKTAVWAVAALDARLFADSSDPLVGAGRRVSGLASFPALEAARVDVFTASKKRTKQGDLGVRFGRLVDEA